MSVINTNIQAITAARNLNRSQEMLGRSLNRLSSGSKIVNPSDDAAGLAVSEKLDAQNKRVKAATTNVQNAVSLVQTADGFMSGMTKILSRMSELAILAKDVTKNTSDVSLYGQEFRALQDQLRQTIGGTSAQIGGTTIDTPLGAFNGIKLFGDDATTIVDAPIPTSTVYGPAGVTASDTYTPGANLSVAAGVKIGTTAAFGDNVSIGLRASIGAGASIGSGVTIGADAYIDANAVIGNNVTIGAGAYIAPGVAIGDNVVVEPGTVILSGPIANDAVVSKADLMSSVTAAPYTPGLNMQVGGDVAIGAGASFGADVVVGSGSRIADNAALGNNVSIGANVYIAEGVTIGDNVVIPDGAVILGDVAADQVLTQTITTTTTASPGLSVTVGQAVGQSMTIPQINLRDGALGAMIRQDANGNYLVAVTDAPAIGSITEAIQDVANERASLGASQSRLELAASTLQVEYENLEAAISRIRDVDVADESTQYARYNILVQSGTAMLAQANQTPQSVLKLLQG